ncbi:polysaccharide deacetylase family protein [Halalkalicoccus jeotgali]|uniref:Polysaccharide deacetylase domain protein n=1 Tax=Halalkalicoccus jeotgali (strain DSM 18796 / CECT 7217 / JCM 14584 / KCTC 4019 / B3) TaxID=795797 RepID=D8J692_HALJB|nr:polysaccharide deacetylase family protein [Halalkalicoccus jeotgali]ADJ15810.1 Polysaccharide deacetylase domain protein [Halalkalicoccus jeotgali B3]ELY37166.1 Polysaccharide deacetylase domain-containing protein [Halalkalicoccus jeotgali B3]
MNGSQKPLTKRAFLSTVGAACLTGCLGAGETRSDPNETTNEGNRTDGNETDPESQPESEPEPEPESEEPTLFLDGDPREEFWDRGECWQDCESTDEWDLLSGSLETSTEHVYRDSRSVRLTSADDGESAVRIPLEGYDLTETSFSLAMYIESPGDHYSPSFDVNAPECDRELHFRTRHKIDEPGWIRYDLGINHTSSLESTEEAYMTISWAGEDVEWYLDDIRAVPVTEEPRLFVQFDDSLRSTHDTAFPIMREYDIPATVFTITGRIGNTGSLTLDQMTEMQEAGWEFASHTHTHQRTGELPLDEQRAELEEAKRWLLEHGFGESASLLAYPFGSFTTDTMDIAADYYDFATHGQRGATNRTINSPLSVNRHPGDDAGRSMELIDILLDERLPTDTLVLYYHDVVENHETYIDPTGFAATMAYIDAQDVDCRLTTELRDYQFD